MKTTNLKHSKSYKYLLRLLSSVIYDTQPPKPNADTDWASVFYVAKEHSLLSMVSYAVEKLDKDLQPSEETMAKLKQIQREDLILESNIEFECENLQSEFCKRNLTVLFLKGMILKHYYPLCSMRTMSDVDILYKSENKDEIISLFEKRGYKLVSDFDGELNFTKPPFYHFELHPCLIPPNRTTHRYFSDVWATSRKAIVGDYLTLSLEDTYLYMMEHMAKHMEKAGAGIRMVMDAFVFLKAEKNNLDYSTIKTGLDALGLTSFEERIVSLAHNWLTTDDPDTESIAAQFILNSSTFGISANAVLQSKIRSEQQSGKKQSGFRIILKKIFPGYKYISGRFQSLKKLKFLYPFYIPAYWCLRLFKDKNVATDNFRNYFAKTDSDEAKYLLTVIEDMGLSERI